MGAGGGGVSCDPHPSKPTVITVEITEERSEQSKPC